MEKKKGILISKENGKMMVAELTEDEFWEGYRKGLEEQIERELEQEKKDKAKK